MKLVRFNVGYLFLVFFIVAGLGASLLPSITRVVEKAKDSEARVLISTLEKALNAHFEEYKKYSQDLEAIGFGAKDSQVFTIYLDMGRVSDEIAKHLNASERPFVTDSSYRILVVVRDLGQNKIFIKDKNSDLIESRVLQ